MYWGTCIILLCSGHFRIPAMLFTNAADDHSDAMDSRMMNEFQRICLRPEAGFVGESSRGGNTSKGNEPDVEVLIYGSSKSDEIRYFNPVDQFWRYEKCRQFNLQLVESFQFNQAVKILNFPLRWVDVEADGNCFYRALSYWVSGTEDNHHIIRLHVLGIVRTDQRILDFLGEENYREHLIWLSINSWATEVEIVAATLLLDTPIYVFSQQNWTWDLFDQNRKSKGPQTETDKCIYIQHISGIHYNLVTDVISDQDQGHFRIPKTLLINAADDNSESIGSIKPEPGFFGESSISGSNYTDEEEMFVGTSVPDDVGYFHPVDNLWQNEKCIQLNLQLKNYFQFNQVVKVLDSPLRWVEVTADIHCLYRALSYWTAGTEEYYPTIRQRVLEIVKTDRRIVSLLGEKNHQAHLNWTTQHFWATEVEIAAATLLLNTSIYVYSHYKQGWELFDQNQTSEGSPSRMDKCIYLQQTVGIHYNLVIDVRFEGNMLDPESPATLDHVIQSAGRCQQGEIRFFYPVDEAWQYDKCFKWNLLLRKPFRRIPIPTFLTTPKKCVIMERDTSSFFRAISFCLTGTEDSHEIIRKLVAKEMFFNRAIQKLHKENKFISLSIQNNFATKIEIIATAVLLDTSIFVYSHATQTWDVYSKNIIDNAPVDTSTVKCIYLSQRSPNEFDVVEDVVGSYRYQ